MNENVLVIRKEKLRKTIDDIEIYFEIWMTGEPAARFDEVFDVKKVCFRTPGKLDNALLLLHGNGEDGSIFEKNAGELCKNGYYCILPDTRGHGKTTCGTAAHYTIDLFAEDLAKFCDELGLGSFCLVGFSDGGNTALTYAVRHPERLSSLAVSGANIFPSGIKFGLRTTLRMRYFAAQAAARHGGGVGSKQWHKAELLSLMVNYPHIAPRLLKNIPCPTLVLEGEHDVISPKHTRLIASSIPNARLVTVSGAGHNVFDDRPDEVNRLLAAHFRRP